MGGKVIYGPKGNIWLRPRESPEWGCEAPEPAVPGVARRTAPQGGAAACHGKSGLPSVHLHLPSGPIEPDSARLPRLVARGYTGLSCPDARPFILFYDGSAAL